MCLKETLLIACFALVYPVSGMLTGMDELSLLLHKHQSIILELKILAENVTNDLVHK
jgi:hypothetical protein